MIPKASAVLGVPIDDVSLNEAVSDILEMMAAFHQDQRLRHVATVNVDFITNVLSWRFKKTRHPELMHILRQADMVTADGMPLVWASKWLGAPLKERVAGSDLSPLLVAACEQEGKSIYFLGGKRFEMTAYRAARILQQQHPGLKIAGIDSPWVHVAGEPLAQSDEADQQIVEKINASGADLLFIAFGSPKQEIWFDRNRHRLKVPVTIGVGATFEFMAGTIARAPEWMQRTGLEWMFRLAQEPRRLWKRYLVDFVKFGLLVWPSVFFYRYEALKRRFKKKTLSTLHESQTLRQPSGNFHKHVFLPQKLLASEMQTLLKDIQLSRTPPSMIVFDFSGVRDLTAGGIGTLIRIWQRLKTDRIPLAAAGFNPRVRRLLMVNRLMDYFFPEDANIFPSKTGSVNVSHPTSFDYALQPISGDIVHFRLAGVFDTFQAAKIDYDALLQNIGDRDCILDLSMLSYIGSSGLMLLLNVSKSILSHGKCFVICHSQKNVRQLLQMAGLNRLFVILRDVTAAKKFIHEVRRGTTGDAFIETAAQDI